MKPSLLFTAWKKLMLAYLISFALSLITGGILVSLLDIEPHAVFEISTKRLSYAAPVLDLGVRAGIDGGIVLFFWNACGALATLSFIYTAAMFNPLHVDRSPQAVRKFFCSRARMKLLCFLPGCSGIEVEALRRLYVWLMVPMIGMVLLGIETGLSASTSKYIFGSHFTGIISLLPHGIVEIPAFGLAGAVAFSGHLLIKPQAPGGAVEDIFKALVVHRNGLPIKKLALLVILGLLVAGLVEAHITQPLVDGMH